MAGGYLQRKIKSDGFVITAYFWIIDPKEKLYGSDIKEERLHF